MEHNFAIYVAWTEGRHLATAPWAVSVIKPDDLKAAKKFTSEREQGRVFCFPPDMPYSEVKRLIRLCY